MDLDEWEFIDNKPNIKIFHPIPEGKISTNIVQTMVIYNEKFWETYPEKEKLIDYIDTFFVSNTHAKSISKDIKTIFRNKSEILKAFHTTYNTSEKMIELLKYIYVIINKYDGNKIYTDSTLRAFYNNFVKESKLVSNPFGPAKVIETELFIRALPHYSEEKIHIDEIKNLMNTIEHSGIQEKYFDFHDKKLSKQANYLDFFSKFTSVFTKFRKRRQDFNVASNIYLIKVLNHLNQNQI